MAEDTSSENLRKFLESDDPALVMMGLSLAKGSRVPEELLPTILGLYMWDDDKSVRGLQSRFSTSTLLRRYRQRSRRTGYPATGRS